MNWHLLQTLSDSFPADSNAAPTTADMHMFENDLTVSLGLGIPRSLPAALPWTQPEGLTASQAADLLALKLEEPAVPHTELFSIASVAVPSTVPNFSPPRCPVAAPTELTFDLLDGFPGLTSQLPSYRRRLSDPPRRAFNSEFDGPGLQERRQSDSVVSTAFVSHSAELGGWPGSYGYHSFVNSAGFESCATPQAELVGTRRNLKRRSDSGLQTTMTCQIRDCGADLSGEKQYCRRYKLCRSCMNCVSLLVDGLEMRFCQQCSYLHPLEEFDGNKRSCREKLQRHALRVRRSRAAAAADKSQAATAADTAGRERATLAAKRSPSDAAVMPAAATRAKP